LRRSCSFSGRIKIKDAETQFATQADQKLLGDVTEFLIESTKFDLPTEFKNGCKLWREKLFRRLI
jgi:hypothetical protein